MEFAEFIVLFAKLKEKELEQRTWELWLAMYPNMTEKTYISFEEMLNTAKQTEVKQEVPVNGCFIDQVFF